MKRALVFDSGVGGLSVLDAMVRANLALTMDYAADNAWLPYGSKSDADLRARCPALIAALAEALAPDVIVVACNTASTIALDAIRAAVRQPVVGVVPPIKPAAALTQSGVIGLLATPATVARAYTDDLIARFAADAHVIRVGSTALVAAAEAKLAGETPDPPAIREAVDALFNAPGGDALDVVALACTHFPLIVDELKGAAPRAIHWLDSGAAIARRVAEVGACGEGAATTRLALFTDARASQTMRNALCVRGFSETAAIGAAPAFALSSRSVLPRA